MARIVCLVILLFGAANLEAANYTNTIISDRWESSASVFECRLVYVAPYLGEAVFATRAGEASAFYMEAKSSSFQSGQAVVSTAAPPWQPQLRQEKLGFVSIKPGRKPLVLDTGWAESLLAQLYAGKLVQISHGGSKHTIAHSSRVALSLSAIGFRPAYREYLGCLAGLLPANFDQVKRTALLFPAGEIDKLPTYEANKLDHILQVVKYDRRVRAFFIDGHSDGVGDRAANLEISKARAEMVAQYFMRRGVPGDWITVRWHGERYPVASNNTNTGRARNRRVTVRLERVEEIEVLPLAAN